MVVGLLRIVLCCVWLIWYIVFVGGCLGLLLIGGRGWACMFVISFGYVVLWCFARGASFAGWFCGCLWLVGGGLMWGRIACGWWFVCGCDALSECCVGGVTLCFGVVGFVFGVFGLGIVCLWWSSGFSACRVVL